MTRDVSTAALIDVNELVAAWLWPLWRARKIVDPGHPPGVDDTGSRPVEPPEGAPGAAPGRDPHPIHDRVTCMICGDPLAHHAGPACHLCRLGYTRGRGAA